MSEVKNKDLPTPPNALQVQSHREALRLAKRESFLARNISSTKARLDVHQNARLTIGSIATILLLIIAIRPISKAVFGELPVAAVVILAVLLLGFVVMVARTRRLQAHLNRLTRLRAFFERQRLRCEGRAILHPAPTPETPLAWEEAIKAAKALPTFSSAPHDLGLLGPHSLWTLIDETLTDGGRLRLLEWMADPQPSIDNIHSRQKMVKDLKREAWFFSRWGLNSNASDLRLACSQILEFVKEPFTAPSFPYWVIATWTVWFASLGLLFYGAEKGWGLYSFAPFSAFSLLSLMQVESPFLKATGLSHHLSELAPVFEALEKRTKFSSAIERLAPVTGASGPSQQTRKLNRVLAFMSTQANPLLHFLLNISVPWMLTSIFFLERRRRKIAYTFPQCLEELSELEALSSLVLLSRYQTSVFPQVHAPNPRPQLNTRGVFHPLLNRQTAVGNDFAFPAGKNLGLLTGSNMAGKSTFLRSIGINQILANMGAPVFALEMNTSPLRLETCIEVSDSLRDGISYFYAEVRKLKSLLDAGTSGQHVLFLIDEIFRGTNNRERHIGSRAVIRTLAQAPHALGFVSTHDLELTHLEERLPSVVNLHFREEISEAGEMVFSYQLHFGPCPTTNALKIMAKEGIAVFDSDSGA